MIKAITTCENICQDFGWLPSFSASLADIAVVVGIALAYLQLRLWKVQRKAERKAASADAVLSSAYRVKELIQSTRLYFVVGAGDGSVKHQAERKLKYLRNDESAISAFRQSWTHLYALTEDPSFKNCAEELLRFYVNLNNALTKLSYPGMEAMLKAPDLASDKLEFEGEEGDEIDQKLIICMQELESFLFPIIQLR